MAITSRTTSNWFLSLKILLTSTIIFSVGVFLKLSIPVILNFMVSELPILWSSILAWLTPPYLYVVINGIIITIAASSRFQHKVDNDDDDIHIQESEPIITTPFKPIPLPIMDTHLDLKSPLLVSNESDFEEERKVQVEEVEKKVVPIEDEVGFVISRSNWTVSRRDSTEIPNEILPLSTEKPLVSVRFGHRKPVKSSPEGGRVLGVTKPKKQDTLESTWKAITDGRSIPLARHLKKSDTWETHGRHHHSNTAGGAQELTPVKKVKKSQTFKDRTNIMPSPGSGNKLKKEPSLSQDELNRRVEAFINKFNEEMRLQRQESLNQYKEIVDYR
ncbi:hypothetical protein IFM89_015373 [Coptis chinensis]|uniref:DUF4408 domain-containing protein n=1 Tax=Coptis chinensis TaxID=261450 RepID=A0A835M819_9MAGN|nr:hypothetical protein IFM89_015373 [Coptis chinensis]